jgi:hypothetical protein
MGVELGIGSRVRPYGIINFGTAGCFGKDERGQVFLITCDHVIKTLAVPEEGPWKIYFPFNHPFKEKIAVFEGKSLITKRETIGDITALRTLVDVPRPSLLPQPVPVNGITRVIGFTEPLPGIEVLLWGARTEGYHPGVILSSSKKYAWPHGKYGTVTYDLQFSVSIIPDFIPEVGDSGGYVITTRGELVGLLAALSGVVTDAGNTIIHCVPLKNSFQLLNLQILL